MSALLEVVSLGARAWGGVINKQEQQQNPTPLSFSGGGGSSYTSFFKMEAFALSLAMEYVVNTEVGRPVLRQHVCAVCTGWF